APSRTEPAWSAALPPGARRPPGCVLPLPFGAAAASPLPVRPVVEPFEVPAGAWPAAGLPELRLSVVPPWPAPLCAVTPVLCATPALPAPTIAAAARTTAALPTSEAPCSAAPLWPATPAAFAPSIQRRRRNAGSG